MTPATLADFADVLFAWVRDNDARAEMFELTTFGEPVVILATWDGVPFSLHVMRRAT